MMGIMKSARLLSLLLLLQVRERMSTNELAERLEVSRRTILRDVEALSLAGVPVYAERGRHGGIVLLAGARLNASHLEPAELESLALLGWTPPSRSNSDSLPRMRWLAARSPRAERWPLIAART